MLLKYFYDQRLAQASYMVGCAKTGEALVVDPMRDIEPYLRAAAENGLRITHITETHIHADFVSGARELAAATGGRLYLSDEGDADWKYAYAAEAGAVLLHDGDSWMVGNVKIEVMATPGHTPEHIAFIVTDTAAANRPMGIFTGDFVFVGDVGRPDLLEEAAGFVGTKEVGARRQFQSVQRVKAMPDYLQIWPGHGAGSACGKALGAIPSSTLGYEKLFNPAFQFTDEDEFVAWLLDGQPEPPRYFARMKHVNKVGPALLKDLPTPVHLNGAALQAAVARGEFVADFRSRGDFAECYLPGTVNIPATSSSYSTYVGWFVDFDKPFTFLTYSAADVPDVLCALRAIGVDNVPGFYTPDALNGLATEPLTQVKAADLAKHMPADAVLIDVRGASEHAETRIAGAKNIPLGFVPRRLAEIPMDRPVYVHCASGYRSQVVTSLLRAHGYTNVANLNDDQTVWEKVLPVERGAKVTVGA